MKCLKCQNEYGSIFPEGSVISVFYDQQGNMIADQLAFCPSCMEKQTKEQKEDESDE